VGAIAVSIARRSSTWARPWRRASRVSQRRWKSRAAARARRQPGSAVAGVGPAPDVSPAGHVLDQLSRTLLADAQPLGQTARREGLGVERAEHVPVRAREVVEALPAEVLVQLGHELLVGEGDQDAEVGLCHGVSI
jgi:hypothetical protein